MGGRVKSSAPFSLGALFHLNLLSLVLKEQVESTPNAGRRGIESFVFYNSFDSDFVPPFCWVGIFKK